MPVLSLIVADFLFFPFITGKNFFFRIVVELLFFVWVIVAVFDQKYRPKKSFILLAISLTVFVLILSTIFGENPYRSFWSNYERMEGLVGHLHLFAYFLILSSVLRVKKDWQILFGAMIGVSFIATIYGFLQFFGKVAIHQSDVRLDATFGNSTYLAIFLIFHLFLISLFLFWFRHLWVRLGLVMLFALEFLVMLLTATRGAILGFFGGLFLFGLLSAIFSRNKKLRYYFILLMIILVAFFGLFMLVKDKQFIKNNYVFSRLANISFSETTVESRFTIWRMSWQGFQEHPFLGWGLENYNLVFNKYYEPVLYKQEPWFDRAHNVFFDWLIWAGLIGFLSYASIFASALYVIWKLYKKHVFGALETSALIALLAAYAFHNLFVFDNLTSYFMFFSVLGYLQFSWLGSEKEITRAKQKEISGLGYLAVVSAFLLVVFSLYFVNIKPLMACDNLIKSLYATKSSTSVDAVLKQFDEVFNSNTFGSGEANEQLSSYAEQLAGIDKVAQQDKERVFKKAIEKMENQAEISSNDARFLLMMAMLYKSAGKLDDALKTINKALEFSSKKQQIYFIQADLYLGMNQFPKALEAMRMAYNLDTSYTEAAKNLAILLIVGGKKEEGEKLWIEKFSTVAVADNQLLNAYIQVSDFEKVRDIWFEFLKIDPNNAQYHTSLAATYMKLNEREKAVEELKKAGELNPAFKEQADYFIMQIQKGLNP